MNIEQHQNTAEFKVKAIKQITERGHNTANVVERLGMSTKSIYK
jgi:transposase-like protein